MRNEPNNEQVLTDEQADKVLKACQAAEEILGRPLSDFEVLTLAGGALWPSTYPAAKQS